ncbi:hypothetical protein [Streptomyces canus]|uniref:hypothetical protein n=1 Tax=Streptomyces canus TaxID=58343 RepID=UPI00277F24F2|nr:hypothetical protein [Streptomyces canus]MDQ0762042.1 hypothetical protein [Streptomyces canus]
MSPYAERLAAASPLAAAAYRFGEIVDATDKARAAEAAEPKVWHFASSNDARTAADREEVADGDVLVVESERIVGFTVGVLPVAITEQHGAFNRYANLGKPAREYAEGSWTRSVERAEQVAIELDYALADPSAAQAARIAAGRPVPIEMPRMLVEPGDVLHAFGARLNVLDTGTRITATGEGEWWALVHGDTEADRRRTYRDQWAFAVPLATAAWDVVTVERVLPVARG